MRTGDTGEYNLNTHFCTEQIVFKKGKAPRLLGARLVEGSGFEPQSPYSLGGVYGVLLELTSLGPKADSLMIHASRGARPLAVRPLGGPYGGVSLAVDLHPPLLGRDGVASRLIAGVDLGPVLLIGRLRRFRAGLGMCSKDVAHPNHFLLSGNHQRTPGWASCDSIGYVRY